MTEEYAEYLNSEAWKARRQQRLVIGNYRCATCGSSRKVQVHHLTYARIFHEEMTDLLPLCEDHHQQAERLIKSGRLSRANNPIYMATETVRLLLVEQPKSRPASCKNVNGSEAPRNSMQQDLMSQEWFLHALNLSRKHFKKECRNQFAGIKKFGKHMANAFALYDRLNP